MSQIFPPGSNTFARISLLGGGLITVFGLVILLSLSASPYSRAPVGIAIDQPVRFSHMLHSGQLNIDCRYCHYTADQTSYGGIPDTNVCMSCHSQIATYSELLEPVRASYATGEPLVWNAVHDLAEHVYFNHSVHVNNGYACETCHGRVDEMPVVWQAEPLSMAWCLDCHNNPAQYVRPEEHIYTFGYEYPDNQSDIGAELIEQYGTQLEGLATCATCHR
jgi:hypothetical protein